jgi:GntR family transcriptional regulator
MIMNRIPAYARVYDTLRRRILEGDYAIGELLPPEPELERQFLVSRTTVRRAVEMLSREGLVEAMQGRGTEVLNYNTTQNINEVTSVSETLERKGYTIFTKSMSIDRIPASVRLAKELSIQTNSPVIRIQRLQLADDIPIAIMRNYLIPDLVPNIEKYEGKFTRLYDFLEEHYSLRIDAADDRISARTTTPEEAEMLHVPANTALIYLIRTCFSNGRIVGVDHCRILGSKYEFEVRMKGRYQKPEKTQNH